MKQITSLLLLISYLLVLSGCTPSTQKKIQKPSENAFRELASMDFGLNQNDQILNQCFTNVKVACYEKYPYMDNDSVEVSEEFQKCLKVDNIVCAKNEGRDDLVQTLQKAPVESMMAVDWFFLSPYKLKKFWDFLAKIKELKKKIDMRTREVLSKGKKLTLKAMHGNGVGVTASAFAVVGHSFTGEAVIHDKELGVFCAPGIQFTTDVGVSLMASGIKTLSCNKNKDYLGKFLTINAGISAETFALPVGAELAYSFGLDIGKLLRQLNEEKKQGNIKLLAVINELRIFKRVYSKEVKLGSKSYQCAMGMGMKLSSLMLGQPVSTIIGEGLINKSHYNGTTLMKRDGLYGKSMGKIIGELLVSKMTRGVLHKHNLKNLKVFFDKVSGALSGCDSISGSVGLALSLSPINIGIAVHEYESLMSVNLDKLLSMKTLSALALMNPLFLDKEVIANIIDFYYLASDLPQTILNKCYAPSFNNSMKKFDLFKELVN